jgi:hypothetical protein
MGCTAVHSSHAPWVAQHHIHPMGHALYNRYLSHGPWVVQQIPTPWPMGCTTDTYPMDHALYNSLDSIGIPCTMGCTTVHPPHGSCTVQWFRQYPYPLAHGLYNSAFTPWVVVCTTDTYPMAHGLCNKHPPHGSCIVQQIPIPWLMGCTANTYPWPMDCTITETVLAFHVQWFRQYWCSMHHGHGLNSTVRWWVTHIALVVQSFRYYFKHRQ